MLALYKQSQVEIEVHFSNKSDSGDDEADDMDDDEENEEEDKKEGHRDNEDYEQDGRDLLNELDARYEHTETEFDQYLAGVGHIITTLFRFVSAIHHPSTHDRPVWYSEVTDPTVRELDKVYIRAQFAEAEKWLIERLGQANMERRRMILPRLLHAGHDLNEQGFAMIKSPIHLSRGVQYPRLGDGSRLDSFICPLYGIGDVDSEPSILESGTEVDNERLLVLPSAISGKERHGSDSMGICPYCLRVTDQSSWR